jgi:tRNA-binding protein
VSEPDQPEPLESTVVVGRVERAEAFEAARKPKLAKLWIDLDGDALPGRQVLCATGLGTVNIAGFESEVLTVGVPGDDGNPMLVTPEEAVPLGGRRY